MMERFKGMAPDEQKQFIARMKDRGQDTSAFEKEIAPAGRRVEGQARRPRRAQTIDALFAPLPIGRGARSRVGCSWTTS